ncbi:MAG: hypothetical protein HQL95_05065 [Magnetococcales bacterium]|nr:hypothetical protein [Magnetococcales bacterium]
MKKGVLAIAMALGLLGAVPTVDAAEKVSDTGIRTEQGNGTMIMAAAVADDRATTADKTTKKATKKKAKKKKKPAAKRVDPTTMPK